MTRISRDEVVALSNLGDIVSKAWHSDLANYLKADAVASLVGLAGAEAATIALHHYECSDLANVIGTLAVKCVCFYGANIAAYTLLHRDKHASGERSASNDATNLSKANIYGGVVAGALKLGGHFAALRHELVPYWAAPLVIYPAAGLIGGAVRHVMNYRNGLIMPRKSDTLLNGAAATSVNHAKQGVAAS